MILRDRLQFSPTSSLARLGLPVVLLVEGFLGLATPHDTHYSIISFSD